VTTQVEQVPVPDWAFAAFGLPVEKRNFRYAEMLYPSGQFKDHWRAGNSVPDVSRPETKLWFYFLGASFIDVGCEAIHLGQTELMNKNDQNLDHYSEVLALIRSYAAKHARRHMVLLDSHVPSGGLVREGRLLMDFHSFPLRIMETPDKPQEAILKVGFSDGIYGRSKGGTTSSGWKCEHLPYLVELDNWGVSRQPGQPNAGGIWIWGYDEITWFAHQSQQYRSNWLQYAWDWVRRTDPNGHLEMPGSRTTRSPRDNLRWYYAFARSGRQTMLLSQQAGVQMNLGSGLITARRVPTSMPPRWMARSSAAIKVGSTRPVTAPGSGSAIGERDLTGPTAGASSAICGPMFRNTVRRICAGCRG
ncbi:MAG: hypothetical protein ABSH34_21330, partial [Verrucomicrobiota bacterium]